MKALIRPKAVVLMVALTVVALTLAASAQQDTARYYKVYNNTTVSAECAPLADYMKVSVACSWSSTYVRVEDDPIELMCESNDQGLDLRDDYDGSVRTSIRWSCPAAPSGVPVEQVERVTKVVTINGTLTSCPIKDVIKDTVLTARVECTYPGLGYRHRMRMHMRTAGRWGLSLAPSGGATERILL